MEEYLIQHCKQDLKELLLKPNDSCHYPLFVDLTDLRRHDNALYKDLFKRNQEAWLQWDEILLEVQKRIFAQIPGDQADKFTIKKNAHVRFHNMPAVEMKHTKFPTWGIKNRFMQVNGTVIRTGPQRILEFRRKYSCSKCSYSFIQTAQYDTFYKFESGQPCPHPTPKGKCAGYLYASDGSLNGLNCIDYVEIKIQELNSERGIPGSLIVTLENDLINSCNCGNAVTIVGVVQLRWGPMYPGKTPSLVMSLQANSVKKMGNLAPEKDNTEFILSICNEWEQKTMGMSEESKRDLLVRSICPQVAGMYYVKLALALVLASCTGRVKYTDTSITTRSQAHLLMIGDPGIAKSILLRAIANISSISVETTGLGSTSAGLTAATVKENNEWHLEAGALVHADGGVCCIDEFSMIKESDRITMHEAMEQQRISVAKAGILSKLQSRCSVVAATNPKGFKKLTEIEQNNNDDNARIGGALLSRFDLILGLRDVNKKEWDSKIMGLVLSQATNSFIEIDNNSQTEDDLREALPLNYLKDHFLAIKNISPQMTNDANLLLQTYYNRYRALEYRDIKRTSTRMLESLTRLAKAHARMLFKKKVTASDALVILQLYESSYGFGQIFRPCNLISDMLPLGPSPEVRREILANLKLNGKIDENDSDNITQPSNVKKGNISLNTGKWNVVGMDDDEYGEHSNDQITEFVDTDPSTSAKLEMPVRKPVDRSILDPEVSKHLDDYELEIILQTLESSYHEPVTSTQKSNASNRPDQMLFSQSISQSEMDIINKVCADSQPSQADETQKPKDKPISLDDDFDLDEFVAKDTEELLSQGGLFNNDSRSQTFMSTQNKTQIQKKKATSSVTRPSQRPPGPSRVNNEEFINNNFEEILSQKRPPNRDAARQSFHSTQKSNNSQMSSQLTNVTSPIMPTILAMPEGSPESINNPDNIFCQFNLSDNIKKTQNLFSAKKSMTSNSTNISQKPGPSIDNDDDSVINDILKELEEQDVSKSQSEKDPNSKSQALKRSLRNDDEYPILNKKASNQILLSTCNSSLQPSTTSLSPKKSRPNSYDVIEINDEKSQSTLYFSSNQTQANGNEEELPQNGSQENENFLNLQNVRKSHSNNAEKTKEKAKDKQETEKKKSKLTTSTQYSEYDTSFLFEDEDGFTFPSDIEMMSYSKYSK